MNGKLYRAGLIPFIVENGTVKFLLMKPSDAKYGGEEFQIAKGKIEKGESPEEAAIREAEEELGLVQSNIMNMSYLGNYLGRTSVFIAEIKDKHLFGTTCFETADTIWMTLAEFDLVGRSLHLHILQDATRAILHQRT